MKAHTKKAPRRTLNRGSTKSGRLLQILRQRFDQGSHFRVLQQLQQHLGIGTVGDWALFLFSPAGVKRLLKKLSVLHAVVIKDSYLREAERDSKSSRFPGIVTMEDTLEEYEALYGDIYQMPDPERAIRKLLAEGFFERHPEMVDKFLKTNKKLKKKT